MFPTPPRHAETPIEVTPELTWRKVVLADLPEEHVARAGSPEHRPGCLVLVSRARRTV